MAGRYPRSTQRCSAIDGLRRRSSFHWWSTSLFHLRSGSQSGLEFTEIFRCVDVFVDPCGKGLTVPGDRIPRLIETVVTFGVAVSVGRMGATRYVAHRA